MTTERSDIERPAGFRSQEAALVIAQMDDQLRLLREAVKDLTVEEIEWQPRPGMNTIGMLLAHIAVIEAWWTMVVLKQDDETDLKRVLGIDAGDESIQEGGEPPANLAGKDFVYFDDLLERARKYVKEAAAGVAEGDLAHEFTRSREDGSKRVVTGRWYLYHIL